MVLLRTTLLIENLSHHPIFLDHQVKNWLLFLISVAQKGGYAGIFPYDQSRRWILIYYVAKSSLHPKLLVKLPSN